MSDPDESDDEVFGSGVNGRGSAASSLDFLALRGASMAPTQINPSGFTPAAPPPQPAPVPIPVPPPVRPEPDSVPVSPTDAAARGGNAHDAFEDLVPVSLPDGFVHAAPPPVPTLPPIPVVTPAPAPLDAAPVPVGPVLLVPDSQEVSPFSVFGPTAGGAVSSPATPPPTPDESPEDDRAGGRARRDREPADGVGVTGAENATGPRRGRVGAKAGGASTMLAIGLGCYALLATVVAVYALFFSSGEKLEPGHPLSTVPDNFGEFDPATRKKVSQYKFPVDGDLPADQHAALGGTITVGGIQVQPLDITKRPLRILSQPVKGPEETAFLKSALVLKLSIRNLSDVSIFPMDPAFTRKSVGDDRPITRLVVNKTTVFPGGAISWPLGERITKKFEGQQANDYVPLKPTESREYVVFTDAKADVVRAVEGAAGPMQWRVQVRRDPIKFRGRELPVTAVIGVDFRAADVKELAPAPG